MKSDAVSLRGGWNVEYNYAVGQVGQRFFQALKQGMIIAPKCPACGLVMLPPRAFCERCFVPVKEWVKVASAGTIQAFTIVPVKFESLPDPPYAIAFVLLDGADTALVNFVKNIDLSDLKKAAEKMAIGTRVKVVFKKRRKGSINDFHYELLDI
ncbi:MAG: Zn-ribbon domain-containing OB-fold protein [Deltaproteobacteria bacterium]|nr:Zn-ribbon domain-containing OB-fold protein [Deltaproteobacteria bacterium]